VDVFLIAKVQADGLINEFQSGSVQFILARARNLKEGQATVMTIKSKINSLAHQARAKISEIVGYGNTNEVINIGRDVAQNIMGFNPLKKDAELIASSANKVGTFVVALADFMLAAEALIDKIRELKTSFNEIECKENEEMDPVLKAFLGNQVEEKRKKALEAMRLIYVLQPNDPRRDSVMKLQEFLVEQKFLPNPDNSAINGDYDRGTMRAKDKLIKMLNANHVFAQKLCASDETVTTVVRRNPDVIRLQTMLKELGYLKYEDKADGSYGWDTHYAFAQFAMNTRNKNLCDDN
jgi:hypothetical protein